MAENQRNSVGALLLIGLGVLFLIGQVFSINFWSILGFSWPVFILIPGVIFLALAFTGDRRISGFIFPGTIITGTAIILWFQNVTDRWESWAYVWTLYPVFVGLGLMFNARRHDNEREYRTGRHMVNFGVIAFVVGAAFFELLIFHGNSPLTGWIVPLALILVGGYLLMTGRSPLTSDKRKNGDPTFPRSSGHVDDLQRKIDEAVAEGRPNQPKA